MAAELPGCDELRRFMPPIIATARRTRAAAHRMQSMCQLPPSSLAEALVQQPGFRHDACIMPKT